jgi:hypothetical protein
MFLPHLESVEMLDVCSGSYQFHSIGDCHTKLILTPADLLPPYRMNGKFPITNRLRVYLLYHPRAHSNLQTGRS